MVEAGIDSILKTEDMRIEGLLRFSTSFNSRSSVKENAPCSNCGKDKNQQRTLYSKDLSRWNGNDSADFAAYYQSSCKCSCISRQELRKKFDNSKGKKKSQLDLAKTEPNGGKDFIAHNIRTCNTYRLRDNYTAQNINDFVHYKDSSDYVNQYRLCKLEKVEKNLYQLDQTAFNEEVTKSLTNSLSTLVGKISIDEKPSISLSDATIFPRKDLKTKEYSQKTIPGVNIFHGMDTSKHPKFNSTTETETCFKCGDKLKGNDFIASISNGAKFEHRSPFRVSNGDKFEDKKVKKLIEKTSDSRKRLFVEKSVSVLNRPEVEQSFSNELQPFCQQMPIKNSALIEKRSNFKKDDWRGHPSSTKPRFSDRFSNISDDPRKNRTASVRNKSLEGVDIFSCYGEKYRLLKEST